MKHVRLVAIAGIVAVAALSPTADAATKKKPVKKVCNIVKDDKGDTALVVTGVPDNNLDIVTGDIASDAKKITAVIRLSAFAATPDPAAPAGRVYQVTFLGQGAANESFLSYTVAPTASAANFGHFDPTTGVYTGDGEATVSVTGNEIHITTSIGSFSDGKFKPGAKITGITMISSRMAGAYANSGTYGYESLPADTANGVTYVAGTPSCVKAGT